VLGTEDVLSEVEVRQPAHSRRQSDVASLHSEHRPVTNAATEACSTDQSPGVRIRRRGAATVLVIPYHRTLAVIHHTDHHIQVKLQQKKEIICNNTKWVNLKAVWWHKGHSKCPPDSTNALKMQCVNRD